MLVLRAAVVVVRGQPMGSPISGPIDDTESIIFPYSTRCSQTPIWHRCTQDDVLSTARYHFIDAQRSLRSLDELRLSLLRSKPRTTRQRKLEVEQKSSGQKSAHIGELGLRCFSIKYLIKGNVIMN